MSSDNEILARLFKQQATIGKLVLDGARDPNAVAALLQSIIDTAATTPAPSAKFALLCDLGYIEVPVGYEFDTALKSFRKVNRKKFYYYNDDISDANFNNPSRVLKAGDRLRVRAFHQTAAGTTTSIERMDFLRAQSGNVFVGAQGAALVFEQKCAELPKGKWYASFDEADRLYEGAGLRCRVPGVGASTDGGFRFDLGGFGSPWDRGNAFLCFCDESLSA